MEPPERIRTSVSWLEAETSWLNDETVVYDLDKARAKYEVRELLDDRCWLILNWDPDRFWLKFALVEFHTEGEDGLKTQCVFHGDGPTDTLRECRHTYWGESGYVFYPNARVITAALEALKEFFDMD